MKGLLPGAATLSALIALAGILLLVTGRAGPEQPAGHGDQAVDQEEQADPGRLLAGNRTHLSLCVDGAGGFATADERTQAVREALEQGLEAENSLPAEFTEREVVQGCPPSTEELGTNIGTSLGLGAPNYVQGETPSGHRLFVYFIPPELFEATWSGRTHASGPAEFRCEGDVCWPLTGAVYVPASVTDADLRDALLDGLRLLPREPNPEPIMDWEACKRGEPPHPDYSCDQYEEWQRDQEK